MSFDKDYSEYSQERSQTEIARSQAFHKNRNRIEKQVETFLMHVFDFVDSQRFHGSRFSRTKDDSADGKKRTATFASGVNELTLTAELSYVLSEDALSFQRQQKPSDKEVYENETDLPLKITVKNNLGATKSRSATVVISQCAGSDLFNINFQAFKNTVFGLLYELDQEN